MAFTIPDSDVAAVPATQSVWYSTDIAIIAAALNGALVVSGCGVTAQGSPDMTVAIAAGVIKIASGVLVTVASGNGTITTADATLHRIDLVSVSNAGVKTVTAGTAAASPKPPALPSGHVALAYVDVPPADTTISSGQITDKSFVAPTITTITNQLAADVNMNAGATTYVDGPACAGMTQGTWILIGSVSLEATGGAGGKFFSKLWNGTTVAASAQCESDEATGNGHNQAPLVAIVTIASGTETWKISCCSDGSGTTLKIKAAMSAAGAGNNASTLTAYKIA